MDEYIYLIAGTSTAALMGLSAYASCYAILKASIHAIPLTNKKSVLTNSYVAVIMSSTIFVYSVILCILMLGKINVDLKIKDSLNLMAAGLIFGFGSFFCSKSFGQICKTGYLVLERVNNFYVIFLCALSAAELITLFAFLISLFLLI